jgi:hypothetical protein
MCARFAAYLVVGVGSPLPCVPCLWVCVGEFYLLFYFLRFVLGSVLFYSYFSALVAPYAHLCARFATYVVVGMRSLLHCLLVVHSVLGAVG